MTSDGGDLLRSLYICYLSLDDPLVETQVVAYLEGLAGRGHTIHLLTFETSRDRAGRRRRRHALAARGIHWHSLRYHKRPSLPATLFDVVSGSFVALWLVVRHGLDAVHARSHVPAAMALTVKGLARRSLIFDIRGLMAEEYVDAGRWPADGLAFRITKRVERAAIARAQAMVVLTERVRDELFGGSPDERLVVIPCCVDLSRFGEAETVRDATRDRLGLGDRPVLVYVGKFGGWYLEGAMADFFAVARRRITGLHFLVLTQADPAQVTEELERHRIGADEYTVTRCEPADVPRFLAASDLAISFIAPVFSKISSSPTKIGEYLGAGLPIVATRGIGDLDALLSDPVVAVFVDEISADAYEKAASAAAQIMSVNAGAAKRREIAQTSLDLDQVGIPRYDRLYRTVAAQRRQPDATS